MAALCTVSLLADLLNVIRARSSSAWPDYPGRSEIPLVVERTLHVEGSGLDLQAPRVIAPRDRDSHAAHADQPK
jgi:hypothetical protein